MACGCSEGGSCCSASRAHCCAVFLSLDAYILGKKSDQTTNSFQAETICQVLSSAEIFYMVWEKKESICKYSACTHLETKILMLILGANWRSSLFSWAIAVRNGLTSTLPATDGHLLTLKRKVIFCHYFLI